MIKEEVLIEKNNPAALQIEKETLGTIREISRKEKGPFYLYRRDSIRQQCRKFQRIPYAHKSIHFATMANINPEFLQIIREEGLGLFVNSIPHLQTVQAHGFKGKEIVFTASAMDETSMQYVRKSGAMLNLDSLNQLDTWKRLFGNAPVGIRCNIGEMVTPQQTHAGYFIGKESRLGLSWEEIQSLTGDENIEGLHIYVGTGIQEIDYFIACYQALGTLIPYFPNLKYLNFGGGFGIDESGKDAFSMAAYSRRVSTLMEDLSMKVGRPLRLILEPGRIIGGKAGSFVCRVTDVKERAQRSFVGVNASSVQFPRPLFYPDEARHPVAIIHKGTQMRTTTKKLTSIYGCSTYSRDFLLREAKLPRAAIGDLLILGNAGSYCTSAFTDFLGFPRPKEYFS